MTEKLNDGYSGKVVSDNDDEGLGGKAMLVLILI